MLDHDIGSRFKACTARGAEKLYALAGPVGIELFQRLHHPVQGGGLVVGEVDLQGPDGTGRIDEIRHQFAHRVVDGVLVAKQ